ncbi:MAG: Nucleotidyltransferase/DNA polymerase involved in repair [Candidatus Saccharibacteria bacterium]|nr:Nucleotidyltransferase/DNA polymerase involved in repair [Candidatus Saccharibacteria bacterium]
MAKLTKHHMIGLDVPINSAEPLTMHVDMNSCFATMEQQANPLLRGRPVGVAAYAAPYGCVIAPSIEAKKYGVKTGMRVWEAQKVCPDIVIIQSHPPLYRDAHMKFRRIFESYSDKVSPKSIDEAVIDFAGTERIRTKSLVDIGYEIKHRVHDEIGEWVRVNVGISTNRFLAKTAAGLHKPDGLDVITKDNLLDTYAGMDLLDISGINTRYGARLNSEGIFTPLQFFDAPVMKLKKQVFKSIVGYYWYLKLRGWEIEDHDSERQSIGHDYTLQDRTNNPLLLRKFMMKLSEKTGRRLRRNKFFAEGIHVWVLYTDHDFWHQGMRVGTRLYTTQDIFAYAMKVFELRQKDKPIAKMGVTVYDLVPYEPEQLGLFDGVKGDINALSRAVDAVNDKYGDMVIGSALLMNMDSFILDRVAFGSVRDMQDLYSDE